MKKNKINTAVDAKVSVEGEFLSGLLELGYGQKVEERLKKLAAQVKWAKGWPQDNGAFWNAEAFMWGHKISKEVRGRIEKELRFLAGKKNLDLGCGSYSYLSSVGFDSSLKMLQFNENCIRKVRGSLEKKLPFASGEFSSVTAVFVVNYVKNYLQLFKEIGRVLDEKGAFVMVLSAAGVQEWQRQKEVNNYSAARWQEELVRSGFKVQFYEKEKLWFFRCHKKSY